MLTTLPEVAVTSAVTSIAYVWPEASAGRANVPPSSSATLGVVPPVHWPGAAAQATAVLARPAAAGSARIAPLTGLGPLFVTVIVYVVVPPAATEATPSVLAMPRSATTGGGGAAVTVSVSVALSFVPSGSLAPVGAATAAVLTSATEVAVTSAVTSSA